jgi:hypothetical protein
VFHCTNLAIQPNKQADGSWRISTHEEFDKKKNIVREIKSRRIALVGHLERMEEHQLTKKITEWILDQEEDPK